MNAQTLEVKKSGFHRWDLLDEFGLTENDPNYLALKAAFDDLPLDPYSPDSGRHRRYARGLFLPWTQELTWMPQTASQFAEGAHGYYQGDNNPEFPGEVVRNLPAVSDDVLNNPLLMRLLQFDYTQTFWSEDDSVWPLYVGLHLMKLRIEDEHQEAVASPNELHQDGEPFVFVHLLYRDNVVGGRNVLATPPHRGEQPEDVPAEDILADFLIEKPLESYGIDDSRVSHYVAPVRRGPEDRPGERSIFIVDWVPMRHKIVSM